MAIEPRPKATAIERGIDRAISFVSPKLAFHRAFAREGYLNFSYEAANPGLNRVTAGSQARNSSSENPKSRRDRIKLVWEARQACNDICLFRGIMRKLPKYVCGRVSFKPNTGDIELDKIYEDYLKERFKSVDVTGRHNLRTLAQVALRSMLIDGDHGGLLLQKPDGIKVQMIEADRIGSPIDASISETLISGFEIDEEGAVVSVHIYNRNRVTNQYLLEGVYPASQFLHIFDPFRIDEYRGVSHIATAIPHIRDLYEVYGFEKTGAKFAAMWAAFVTKKDPYKGGGNGDPVLGWDTNPMGVKTERNSIEAQPGRIQVIDQDTQISIAQGINRPGPAFMNLTMALVREFAISMDLSYGFCYDMSELGGATARLAVEQDQRTIEHWQSTLEDRFLDPVKNAMIDYGIAVGDIPATQFPYNGKWTYGAQITADLSYQNDIDIQNILMGLDSATDVCERRGRDYSQINKTASQEIKDAQATAGDNATPMELMAPQRWQNATQMLAAINTPVTPPPQPGSLEIIGDKGAKNLVEILTNVSSGMLDRKSAINTLITVYGMDNAKANAIVPPQGKKESQEKSEPKELRTATRLVELSSKIDRCFAKPGARKLLK